MTTLGKTLFITLSLAVLIAGTLALRSEPEPAAPAHAQLTAAQIAEMQPAAKPADPPKATASGVEDEPKIPDWDEPEDGSGS
jgi:hypothetical protein